MEALTEAYASELMRLMAESPDILVMSSDAVTTCGLGPVLEASPERCRTGYNGRQDMLRHAVEAADSGLQVWVHTTSAFASHQGTDQLRRDVFFSGRNVKLVGFHNPASSPPLAAGRMAVEDLGVMRAMPCSTVLVPADATSVRVLIRHAAGLQAPAYIRIHETPLHRVYQEGTAPFPTKATVIREGWAVVLFACGSGLYPCVEASDILRGRSVAVGVVDLHTVKPVDEYLIRRMGIGGAMLVAVEERAAFGGLGSAVADVLSDIGLGAKVTRLALDTLDSEASGISEAAHSLGLTPVLLAEHILALFRREAEEREGPVALAPTVRGTTGVRALTS